MIGVVSMGAPPCEGADSEKVSNYIQNIEWKGDWYGQIYTSP